MKKIILFLGLFFVTFVTFSQWSSYGVRGSAKSNDYFVVKNADNANTQKMTLTTLTSLADSIRESKDDSIYYYTGLGTDGTYQLATGSNYLTASGFSGLGYSQNIHNATLILDSVLAVVNIWESSNGTYSVIQSNGQDTADGDYAVAMNYQNSAQKAASIAMGSNAVAYEKGMRAFAGGSVPLKSVAQWGANQTIEIVEYIQTIGATADTLTINGVDNNYLDIPTDMSGTFTVELIGTQNAAGGGGLKGDTYTRTIVGGLRNIAGTTSLVGTVDTLVNNADANTLLWTCSVVADDGTDALLVIVSGLASQTIQWTAYIRMTTVGFGNFNIE